MTTSKTPHIDQVREHLMQTLADLRNREQPMVSGSTGLAKSCARSTSRCFSARRRPSKEREL